MDKLYSKLIFGHKRKLILTPIHIPIYCIFDLILAFKVQLTFSLSRLDSMKSMISSGLSH